MLLVDAANVIGSRPTGWWRDRPGAARQLVDRLQKAATRGTVGSPVVVVLEGAARGGVGSGDLDDVVRVVHAAGSGDDTLVELAAGPGQPVRVVTADRALRRRLEDAGAEVVGPSWLLNRLDHQS